MSFWSLFRRRAAVEPVVLTPITTGSPTTLRRSLDALLDPEFYLTRYPDVRDAGVDPFEHFASAGESEGRHPLDITLPDAAVRIELALSIDPQNAGAHRAHAILLLASDTVEGGRLALKAVSNIARESAACNYLQGEFEQFVSRTLGKCLRFEFVDDFREALSLVDEIANRFPHSTLLGALAGLFHFEANDLAAAEKRLRGVDLAILPEGIAALCSSALMQIEEAKGSELPADAVSGVLLLDTSFPSQISSFRFGEFSSYLGAMEQSVMLVRPDDNLFRYGEQRSFGDLARDFNERSIRSSRAVGRMCTIDLGRPQVAYCVFLNLAHLFFNQIGLPNVRNLVFTLYPGGGFAPGDRLSDIKLAKLFDNPALSKVVTTQNLTRNYLVDKGYCNDEDIVHIFGGIVPAAYTAHPAGPRPPRDGVLNVCFVAQRYSPQGAEKGYDVFAQVVRIFASSSAIHFHVVGGFDRDVIDLGGAENITFYGTRPSNFFAEFYRRMHVVLSPNIRLSDLDPAVPAAFDGFPTTAVVEAGLQGVAMLATDFLGMNRRLDGSRIFASDELLLIDREPENIAQILRGFMADPDALQRLRVGGQRALLREFSFERQMRPRIQLLESYL